MSESKKVEVKTLRDGKKYIKKLNILGTEYEYYELLEKIKENDDDPEIVDIKDGEHPEICFEKVFVMADIIDDGKDIPTKNSTSYRLSEEGIQHFKKNKNS